MRGTIIHISEWSFVFQDSLPGSFRQLALLMRLKSNLVYKSTLMCTLSGPLHCEMRTASFMGRTSASLFPCFLVFFQNMVSLKGKVHVSWMFGSASSIKHFRELINIDWLCWGEQNQRGVFSYSCHILVSICKKHASRNFFSGASRWPSGRESICQSGRQGFNPWSGKITQSQGN